MTCDFQPCGILTCVDSDGPVQLPFKFRNSKWCSVSSLTLIEYSSDKQRLWSDCAYAQAGLSLCWSHRPHCWKYHVTAYLSCRKWSYSTFHKANNKLCDHTCVDVQAGLCYVVCIQDHWSLPSGVFDYLMKGVKRRDEMANRVHVNQLLLNPLSKKLCILELNSLIVQLKAFKIANH